MLVSLTEFVLTRQKRYSDILIPDFLSRKPSEGSAPQQSFSIALCLKNLHWHDDTDTSWGTKPVSTDVSSNLKNFLPVLLELKLSHTETEPDRFLPPQRVYLSLLFWKEDFFFRKIEKLKEEAVFHSSSTERFQVPPFS